MTSRLDYMTITIKSNVHSFFDTIDVLANELWLKKLLGKMIDKGAMRFYQTHLSYENIEILLPSEEDFEKQGICIRFSSQGLDFFVNYLDLLGISLRQWCQRWRSLSLDGFLTKCTRLDYAIDDKRLEGDGPALLTMRKVYSSIANGEFCTRGGISSEEQISAKQKLKSVNGEKICGKTLYIGSRQSERLIRFYDKKAEQLQKKRAVLGNLVSWVRCEVEFHRSFAMCVFNAFCDYSDELFVEFMANALNSQFRFINLDNKNVSRCSLKRWWVDFLDGCKTRFVLKRLKPARSALARSLRCLKQNSRVLNSLFQCVGLEGLYSLVSNNCRQMIDNNRNAVNEEIVNNFYDNDLSYKNLNSFENYTYNSNFDFDEQLFKMHCEKKRLFARIGDYCVSSNEVYENSLLEQYINGQELIFS